ncbi:MAG: hypothetical protein O7D32_08525 [bacterium]|nr:hypothetical protein [bacterium]
MEKTKRISGRDLTVVLVLSAVLLVPLAMRVDSLWPDHPVFSIPADHQNYIAMAERPGDAHRRPFAYRLLMPYVAGALPFDLATNFYVLTLLFLLATPVFMYGILRELDASPHEALLGIALLFSLNWWAKFLAYDFWLTEPALICFATASLWMMLRGRPLLAGIALGLAVLSKESALFLIPFYYVYKAGKVVDPRALRKTAILAAVPLAVFVGMRLWMPISEHDYSPLALLRQLGPWRPGGLRDSIRAGTTGTWGLAVPVLAIVGCFRDRRFARASLAFLVLVYIQPTFDRLLVYGLVVVIPLAVVGLRQIAARFALRPWMTWTLVLIPYVLILLKENYQSPPPEQRLIVIVLWLIAVLIARRFGEHERPGAVPG